MRSSNSRLHGASLLDVMFAISVVAFASAALFLLCSNALQLLQNQQETEAATLALQDRAEQLRATGWDVLTGGPSLLNLLRAPPASAGLLPGYTEAVTVSAWPAVTGGPLLSASRTAAGATSLLTQSTGLLSAAALRVDLRATWQGRGRTHVRENSIILAQGGLVR